MNSLCKFIVTVAFAASLLWLSFANRDSIELNWSPLHEPADIPVAALVLIAAVAGFVWGALIVWLNTAPLRRERRRQAKDVSRLEKELSAAAQTGNTAQNPLPHSTPPLLP